MPTMIHLLHRKLRTFLTTVARVSNWPSVSLARMGWGGAPRQVVHLRSGMQIEPLYALRQTWGEIFEPAIADLYEVNAEPADVIVDVGANIGSFTCLAALAHPQAVVHAFEPSVEHADQLERNVRLNGLSDRVKIHRQAVTADGRDICYHVNGAGGSSGIFLPGDSERRMSSVSLDAVDFKPFRRALIKLDCEGAEGEIVPWMCENRARLPKRVRLGCEYHSWSPVKLDELMEKLRAAGFEVSAPIRFDEQYLYGVSSR